MDRTQPGPMNSLMDNQPPPADAQALWQHFSETYFSLRFGLAVLAFAFPAWLYFWGRFVHDLPLQPSMSAYFFAARASAEAGAMQCAEFPMRTFFVGALCAIAAGLHLYKGLTRRENTLLNSAAICALFVAVFPERITEKDLVGDDRVVQLVKDCTAVLEWAGRQPDLPIHFAAAAALFALLGIVAWQCASHSLSYLPADQKHSEPMLRRAYRVLAVLMFLCPDVGLRSRRVQRRRSNHCPIGHSWRLYRPSAKAGNERWIPPRAIEFVDTLSMTATGKLMRRELRARAGALVCSARLRN